MMHVLLCIIGYESEDLSDRKEIIKEAKYIIGFILKYLDKSGSNWIQFNFNELY